MLFEVKSITPKWSTNRFPTIAIDTSNSITAYSISLEIIKNNKEGVSKWTHPLFTLPLYLVYHIIHYLLQLCC